MESEAPELPDFQEYAQEPAATGRVAVKSNEKEWAMYCHMSALVGIPLGGLTFLGPLLLWMQKRNVSPFVDLHGKEALNFQLNILVPYLITIPIAIVTAGYGILLTFAVLIYGGVMAIMAGMKAGEGQMYQYPAIIRVIK